MDGGGNDLLVERGGIGGKGSMGSSVTKMAECLSSIKVCAPHHYSFILVCWFYYYDLVVLESSEGQ